MKLKLNLNLKMKLKLKLNKTKLKICLDYFRLNIVLNLDHVFLKF